MERDEEWVICPHCGYKHGVAWNWCADKTPSLHYCDDCDQKFKAWAEYEVQYVTMPL